MPGARTAGGAAEDALGVGAALAGGLGDADGLAGDADGLPDDALTDGTRTDGVCDPGEPAVPHPAAASAAASARTDSDRTRRRMRASGATLLA